MRLRRLTICGFRGIQSLNWLIVSPVACLVGPGDSGKTTILDAIELALLPRWSVQLDDSDFFGGKPGEIVIEVVVSDVPDKLLIESKFGTCQQGLKPDGSLAAIDAEHEEDQQAALLVRFRAGSDLEPHWYVVDAAGEEHPLSTSDRELFGVGRIGPNAEKHLAWSRGSALLRLTEDTTGIAAVLAEAMRKARQTVGDAGLTELVATAGRANEFGKTVGVHFPHDLRPSLDVGVSPLRAGGLSLHSGDVPVRRSGDGTRRLLSLAIQQATTKSAGLALIDEIETGLEPHRLRRILRLLRGRPPEQRVGAGHVVMTTHSPVVVAELDPEEVCIVRRLPSGGTSVTHVPRDLPASVNGMPEALVSRFVIACEGKTEMGVCMALDRHWEQELSSGASLAYRGVALVDGGGRTYVGKRAMALRTLGYEVVVFADSDEPLDPATDVLAAAGITVVVWDDACATEDRVARDLPLEGLIELVQLAMEHRGDEPVAAAVSARVPGQPRLSTDPSSWFTCDAPRQAAIRAAIGSAAKKEDKPWFKSVYHALPLGRLITKHLNNCSETDLAKKVQRLRHAVHGR